VWAAAAGAAAGSARRAALETIASLAGSRLIAAMAWEAGTSEEPAAAGGTGVATGAPT
jgi:hypothetical protein